MAMNVLKVVSCLPDKDIETLRSREKLLVSFVNRCKGSKIAFDKCDLRTRRPSSNGINHLAGSFRVTTSEEDM